MTVNNKTPLYSDASSTHTAEDAASNNGTVINIPSTVTYEIIVHADVDLITIKEA